MSNTTTTNANANTDLLTIEENFLSLRKVKSGLRVTEFNAVSKSLETSSQKKFNASVEMAKIVAQGIQWADSPEGQLVFESEGLKWSKEELFKKTYGFQKSFGYKLLKVAKLNDEVITEFNTICDNDRNASRSIENLLKWCASDVTTNDSGDTEGDGGEGEVGQKAVFTLSFKSKEVLGSDKNVAFRVNADGEVVTKNTMKEIEQAIAWLQSQLTETAGECVEVEEIEEEEF
jgi:hypothetical protein